jgi:hypothetical protein
MELRESFPAVGTARYRAIAIAADLADGSYDAGATATVVCRYATIKSTLALALASHGCTVTVLPCTAPLRNPSSLFPAGTRAAAVLVLVLVLALALALGPGTGTGTGKAKQSGWPRLVALYCMHPACFHALRNTQRSTRQHAPIAHLCA